MDVNLEIYTVRRLAQEGGAGDRSDGERREALMLFPHWSIEEHNWLANLKSIKK
jgi:hypothetical protein